MENQIFDLLEQKIIQVLNMASHLKAENQELHLKNQQMQAKLEEKERILLTLREDAEQRKKVQDEIETYKGNQDRIRSKIENLIEKLREFEEIP